MELKEIMKLIKDVKVELRKEFNFFINNNYQDKKNIKDTTALTFVELSKNGTFDDTTIKEHSDLFLEWQIGVSYKQKDICRYNNELYKCLQDHTSQDIYPPDISISQWKKVGSQSGDYPEWSQPIGAGDEYKIGDKVSYNGKHYISIVDNNVWRPDVYGWNKEN